VLDSNKDGKITHIDLRCVLFSNLLNILTTDLPDEFAVFAEQFPENIYLLLNLQEEQEQEQEKSVF